MGKEDYKDLINLSKEMFYELSLDGLKTTTISKANYLIDTICKIYDYELYCNPFIVNTIFLLEYLNPNNILLNASISAFKLNSIKLSIDNFDKDNDSNDTSSNISPEECPCEEKEDSLEREELENGVFIIDDKGKRVKNEKDYPLPPKGKVAKIRRTINGDKSQGIEYTIDSDGYVVLEEEIGSNVSLDDIDFDEIYTFSLDEALEYNDIAEKAIENDL